MPRKRGAQPNNQNALKHGFYAKEFKASERRALSESKMDMDDEIDAMRVHLLRFLEFDNAHTTDLDYKTQLAKLRAMSIFMGRLAGLVRMRNGGVKSPLEQEVETALNELREEMGID